MTDDRLRELERRFQQTGSADDEAASLRARLQTGLEAWRVAAAAACGHEAARLVVGATPDADDMLLALVTCAAPEVVVRTWIAIGWSVFDLFGDERTLRDLVDLEQRLCGLPLATPPRGPDLLIGSRTSDALWRGEELAVAALAALRGETIQRAPHQVAELAALRVDPAGALEALRETVEPHGSCIDDDVRAELVPWLLARADALRARVDARQGAFERGAPPRRARVE